MTEIEYLQADVEALKLALAVVIASLPREFAPEIAQRVEATRQAYEGKLLWTQMSDGQLARIADTSRLVAPPQGDPQAQMG